MVKCYRTRLCDISVRTPTASPLVVLPASQTTVAAFSRGAMAHNVSASKAVKPYQAEFAQIPKMMTELCTAMTASVLKRARSGIECAKEMDKRGRWQ